MNIQKYINEHHKYLVDKTYQRPNNVWSKEDKECLIDSIIRGEPIPIFFFNFKNDNGVFYVVDGQQRLNTIRDFYTNKIKLNEKFSGKEKHGQTFNDQNPISDDDRNAFLNYELQIRILEDYDDERVRMIFSRLQRGKPLQLGERLNALPGNIVVLMREIAKHDFLHHSIGIKQDRYGHYPDAGRILFYEEKGSKQCGTKELMDFFNRFKSMDNNSKAYKKVVKTLNLLLKCFPKDPGDYQFLNKHAWVHTLYTSISDVITHFSLTADGSIDKIMGFTIEFHGKVYNPDFRQSNHMYQIFYDNVRGGWSEQIIETRKTIFTRELLKWLQPIKLDSRRQVSEHEMIEVFSQKKKCELCGKNFKDHKEPEFHHKKRFIDGGQTDISNIVPLCKKCHDFIHGNSIKLCSPLNEIDEDEIENEMI